MFSGVNPSPACTVKGFIALAVTNIVVVNKNVIIHFTWFIAVFLSAVSVSQRKGSQYSKIH